MPVNTMNLAFTWTFLVRLTRAVRSDLFSQKEIWSAGKSVFRQAVFWILLSCEGTNSIACEIPSKRILIL